MSTPRTGPAFRLDQARTRAANLGLVARTVYAAALPPTRADVAAETALTRSTVSRLVDDLIEGGLVAELAPVTPVRRGRPGTPLGPDAGRFAALGLQVNVGYLAALVVDLTGVVRVRRHVVGDLPGTDPRHTLRRLAMLAREAAAEVPTLRLVGGGLALPGIVAVDGERLMRAPNLGWSDVDVPALLSSGPLAGVPIRVGNEADLASRTVAAAAPGRPSPLQHFIYVSGDIGIGGSVVLDGHPLSGRHGWGGEIGHVTVDPSGPACPCGSTGCLEQYAGRRALLTAAGLDPEATTAELAARLAGAERRATAAVDRAAWALGIALAGAINLVDVPVVVLGGHLRELADDLGPRLESTLARRVLSARWVPPSIRQGGAEPSPGALGAAYLELERVISDPVSVLPAQA